jgi:hypothetical protein
VNRCQSCGREFEEGVAFCPHCGKPAEAQAAREAEAAPSNVVRTSAFEWGREEHDSSRRIIFIAVAIVAALLIAGLAYLASRPAATPGEERLAGAVRPGSADFPGPDRLIVDFNPDENAVMGANALGNYVVTLQPTVRNFTGRAISGLEFHAAGLDRNGQVIRERIFARDVDIEPNRINTPALGLNFPPDNRPAQLKLELTGVRFR